MHEHAVDERHPSEADLVLHREKSLAGAGHLDGHVAEAANGKLEVVHAIRSSAEWISRAASCGSIVRIGKKP